jgi:DNA-dependent RNA polymerase auxiliary subunit epsilon
VKKSSDFIFGEFRISDDGRAELDMEFFLKLRNKFPDQVICDHVTRFLSALETRQLEVTYGASNPPFRQLIEMLGLDRILVLEVFARHDQNPAVRATLGVDLYLDCGLIRVTSQWCARSENRARELVDTLLYPVFYHSIQDRLIIRSRTSRGDMVQPRTAVRELMKESEYLSAFREEYVQILSDAIHEKKREVIQQQDALTRIWVLYFWRPGGADHGFPFQKLPNYITALETRGDEENPWSLRGMMARFSDNGKVGHFAELCESLGVSLTARPYHADAAARLVWDSTRP